MHTKKPQVSQGFTLIELLVVIAIIGILSSVVLASLNSARGKGGNAAVKSNLANIRAQAELYYDDHNQQYSASNGNTCNAPGTLFFADAQIAAAISAAEKAGGGSASCFAITGAASAWAVSVPLKIAEGGNGHWCVDSTGVSKGTAAATTDTTC